MSYDEEREYALAVAIAGRLRAVFDTLPPAALLGLFVAGVLSDVRERASVRRYDGGVIMVGVADALKRHCDGTDKEHRSTF
jgi:hypothetical protein